jgi:hypothetical protein
MNPLHRGFGWSFALVMPLWLSLSTVNAWAQLGLPEPVVRGLWGRPIAGEVDTNGFGALSFLTNGISITAEFMDGVARRTRYRMSALDEESALPFLVSNDEGCSWRRWPAASRGTLVGCTVWSRSDERAMAVLKEDQLVVSSREWNAVHAQKPRLDAEPAGIPATTNEHPAAMPDARKTEDDSGAATLSSSNAPPLKTTTAHIVPTPPPKPRPPSDLPLKGDSTETVLERLGKPKGTMSVSGREAWLYPWGTVWITDGKVQRIEL